MKAIAVLSARSSRAPMVALLCVCVLSQMLGMPGTLVGLLASLDLLTETVSADFSLTQVVPELEKAVPRRLHLIFHASPNPPVFVTTVFHPPPAWNWLR